MPRSDNYEDPSIDAWLFRIGSGTSSLAFGSYRIDAQAPEHAAALGKVLLAGVNLIDTSTNYADGSSETCLGNGLARHRREELIVVSKAGYVQGQALTMARAREQGGAAFPKMVKYTGGCGHCIHPQFLADQLERLLRRLQLKKMNVYHYLEGEVRRGGIGFYGVSSNTFVVQGRNRGATSLARMWMIVRQVVPEHHFAVAQLPTNLFESGAMLTRNCVTDTQTALEFAQEHGLAVLVNRTLNAFYRNQLIRLAATPVRRFEVHARVDPFLPPAFRAESLSRKALAFLANTKGVTCVLSGMRRQNYVEDSLGALRSPAFDVDLHLYEAFAHM